MKKLLFIISLLMAFPIITSAHTTVSSTNPSEGEVVTEELRELTVEFAGSIENQSTLTLVNEQKEEIEIDTIKVEEKKITGLLTSPLENGNYTFTWNVASKDGHVVSGSIPFTVNLPKIITEDEVEGETGQGSELEQNTEKEKEAPAEEKAEVEVAPETETVKDNSTIISTISIIALVILLAFGIWLLLRKKR